MEKKNLYRVPYLVRTLLLIFGLGLVTSLISPLVDQNGRLIMFLAAILIFVPVKIFGFDLQRIRNIGWSPWLLLLHLVPGVGSVLQILLFVIPAGKHIESPVTGSNAIVDPKEFRIKLFWYAVFALPFLAAGTVIFLVYRFFSFYSE